jgi:type IV secretory pathway protease TraF
MNRHIVTGALGCLLVLYVLYGVIGLRWNDSPSTPVGLWRITHEHIRRGSYVTVETLIKQVAGVPGDRVTFSAEGVTINGKLWPDSAPVGPNHTPFNTIVLGPDQWLLMGDHPLSWDGRYWTPTTVISSTVEPIWVKK